MITLGVLALELLYRYNKDEFRQAIKSEVWNNTKTTPA